MSKTTEYVSLELSRLDLELRNEQIRHEKAVKRMRNRIARIQAKQKEYGTEEKRSPKG